MASPRVQLFTADEFDRRIEAVRRRLEERGLDALVLHSPENIYYLSGYQTPGYYWHQALVLPVETTPVFIPPPHEASLVPEFCWIDDVRMFPDTSDWAQVTAGVLKDVGLGSARIGLEEESRFLSVDLRDRLAGSLPDAKFENGSGLVESGRLIKSPQEIEYMREAARYSTAGMAAGMEAVRERATELEVAAAVHSALDLAGSEYSGLPAFITSGERSELVHATWSPWRMKSGDIVFLEIPGSHNRYHAAHSRSVSIGDPPDALLRADEISQAALSAAKAVMRPGVPANEVFESGRAVIDGAGLGYRQGRRIAYGIGTAFPPGWDEGDIFSINVDESRPLQAGMTFHLITTMRLAGIGAIGCSDTVLVTDDGVETLTSGIEPGVRWG